MKTIIFQIFFPFYIRKKNYSLLCIILILSLGIGIWLTIDNFFNIFYNNLISIYKESLFDIEISEKKDFSKQQIEERNEKFFNNIQDKLIYSFDNTEIDKIKNKIFNIDNLLIERFVQFDNNNIKNIFIKKNNNILKINKFTFIGFDKINQSNVLPLLDNSSDKAIELFNNYKEDNFIPLIISEVALSDINIGDEIYIDYSGDYKKHKIIDIIKQNKILSFPLFIVPLNSINSINSKFKISDQVAIRLLEKNNRLTKRYQKIIKDSLLENYNVILLSEKLLTFVKGILKSIIYIINCTLSSLFIISFFMSIIAFDTLLKQHKKHLAILLSLGTNVSDIKFSLISISIIIGLISFLFGIIFYFCFHCLVIYALPILHYEISNLFFFNYDFSISPSIFITCIILTLLVMICSALNAIKHSLNCNPIEDLRK